MIGKATKLLLGQYVRKFAVLTAVVWLAACAGPQPAGAAPYSAHVMDARTGETLYAENAETRLHPASLTKMMTLYVAFEEIQRGRLSLDTMVTVSKHAAAQPPSRLGLKAGQKIQLRYLIRAAAVKSANDAAAAIGDHISGSPEKFAARMTKTARALGMKDTTFKNAHGLTAKGHLSTSRDMSVLGRHLFYDFPQYYNIFSRRSTDAGIAQVNNTNRRFLDAYKGADGIKTGYTDAAGFNLTGSAERDGVRIIATVFGGKSTADRNAKMADLLDLGFRKAGKNVKEAPPTKITPADDEALMAATSTDEALPEVEGGAAKTLRLQLAVNSSPRPQARPELGEAAEEVVASMQDSIAGALAEATSAPPPADSLQGQAAALTVTAAPAVTSNVELVAVAPPPAKRAAPIYDEAPQEAVAVAEADSLEATEVVTLSTSGGRHYGVLIGQFNSHNEADRFLTKTVLAEGPTLGHGLRKVVRGNQGFTGSVLGLTQREADLACARLQARGVQCFTMGEAAGG
ncbi:D-alanyl-D-alanine carboxypeptidase family protein [Tabrizicola sp.]|uniref:D-alanyl-D-alanine carboxypeptidase family protein n=1 Tax=Tabrizicola sp. TaxID=2005166 RepID=UPI003D29ACCD